MPITPVRFDVLERTTPRYTATIVDDQGNSISSDNLTTLILTVYEKKTSTILNGRDGQNVKNTNNVTIDSNGLLVWSIQAEDLAIVNTNNTNETHVALFQWTWNTGTKSGKHEVELIVKNITKVP